MIVHLNSFEKKIESMEAMFACMYSDSQYIILQHFVKVWKVNIYYLWNVCLMHYLSGHCIYLDLTVHTYPHL